MVLSWHSELLILALRPRELWIVRFMFGRKLLIPTLLLAIAWFALYVLALGCVLVLLAWLEFALMGSSPPAKSSGAPDIIETIFILILFVLIALFWRSALCLKSDVRRAIKKRGGSFYISGKEGLGTLLGVSIEVKFDRPFLDYWPHPRGKHKKIVYGEEVSVPVGSYNPEYMRKMSTIKLCLNCDADVNVRLCSSRTIECRCDFWRELSDEFNEVFGNGFGDWEFKITDGVMGMEFKSGSWEGGIFISKINCGLDKLLSINKKY